ncbi:MAG: PQQ-like beta-propeller repeat protein [Kiritimatiellae bacterium]|nr:PQQ-like beta-propeller repeat protein [Kiritimatiellia bacterium]
MKKTVIIPIIAVALTLLIGFGVIRMWMTQAPKRMIVRSVPGMDDLQGEKARFLTRSAGVNIKFGGVHKVFDVKPSGIQGGWSRFRGAKSDGINGESAKLADTFVASGPGKIWETAVGPGYAGPAVYNGRVFLLDYDASSKAEILRCLSLDDGREIWRSGYHVDIKSNHGISRTVPAVTEKYVATFGAQCHVMCVDTDTGTLRWGLDLKRRFGAKPPMWHAGQCPLIDDGLVILAPAVKDMLMMAISCETGEIVWRTANPHGWRMSHSSVTPMTVAGTRMYVYAAIGGVVAVAADGDNAGELLWETSDWSSSVVIPSPVVMDDDRIFVTSGYDGGSAVIKIVGDKGRFLAKTFYNYRGKRKAKKCFSTYQQTPIYYKKHLFGIQLNTAVKHKMEFVCVVPDENGGRFVWTSGNDTVLTASRKRDAWGPYMLADNKFYVMSDTGMLVMFDAQVGACRKLGEWQLMDGQEVWGPLAIAGERLLVRDVTRLMCFDIGE